MEPRNDNSNQPTEARQLAKKPRFQIIKLEERIAPGRGGNGTNNCGGGGGGGGGPTNNCTHTFFCN
jgi:hypothetical protein